MNKEYFKSRKAQHSNEANAIAVLGNSYLHSHIYFHVEIGEGKVNTDFETHG